MQNGRGRGVAAAVCGALAFVACKTTDERPPTITLPSRSESRTPIYDSLSPPDRDEADRVLRGCRDAGGGCSDSLLQLDTGQLPMAVAEAVCGDGRADVCAVDSDGDPIERLRELSCREARVEGQLNRRPHAVDALQFQDPADTARAISVRSRTDGRRKLYAGNFARDGYDYVFPLGVVSASRPAVPEKR